jgi:hypothetical protein
MSTSCVLESMLSPWSAMSITYGECMDIRSRQSQDVLQKPGAPRMQEHTAFLKMNRACTHPGSHTGLSLLVGGTVRRDPLCQWG